MRELTNREERTPFQFFWQLRPSFFLVYLFLLMMAA